MPGSSPRWLGILKKMKQKGYRLTPQRLAVAKILSESQEHPNAQQIYERVRKDFPAVSFATIYKIMGLLRDIGEVMELSVGVGASRFDGARPFPHPHLICTGCQKIWDPEIPMLDDLPRKLAKKTGFRIHSHRLDFFGLCPRCQRKHEKH